MSLYFWAENETDSNFVHLNYVLKRHDVLVNSLLLASVEYDFINTKYKHGFSLRQQQHQMSLQSFAISYVTKDH